MTPADFLEWEKKAPGIDFKVQYVDVAGDHAAGFLLSQIIYWSMPGKNTETKLRVERDENLWIAKTHFDWWQETRLTKVRFNRALKVLIRAGLVTKKRYKFKGTPMLHIRLNVDVFLAKIAKVLSEPALPFEDE